MWKLRIFGGCVLYTSLHYFSRHLVVNRVLKIKKVDDKPMVIHTKDKAKIHTVQPKELSIKGRNVLSRENVPKIKGATVNTSSLKESQKYRKATKHQAGKDETCVNRNVNQKQGIQKAKDSIKKKDSNLKYVGLAGAKTATAQMEGGEELRQSAMVAYGIAKPITGTVSKTSETIQLLGTHYLMELNWI